MSCHSNQTREPCVYIVYYETWDFQEIKYLDHAHRQFENIDVHTSRPKAIYNIIRIWLYQIKLRCAISLAWIFGFNHQSVRWYIYTYTHQTLVYNLLYNVIFLLTASIITMKQPYLLTVYRGCAISLINILLYEKKRKDDKESLELTPVH